jgi:hypothetical protein
MQVLLETLDFLAEVEVEVEAHQPLVRVVLVILEPPAQVPIPSRVLVVLVVELELPELREGLEISVPQVLRVIQVLLELDTRQAMQAQMEVMV